MEPQEKQPLLAHNTSTHTPSASPTSHTHETEAEHILLLLRASTAMFPTLRRPFLPKLTTSQLSTFFTRPPGPIVPKERNFTIRRARFGDVPDMVMIQARADFHMPVMQIFHPKRAQFPQGYLTAFWESGMLSMCKPGALTYVAVSEGEVVGEIRFLRQGDGKRGTERQHGWMGLLVDWGMTVWGMMRDRVPGLKLGSKRFETEAEKNAAQRVVEMFEHAEKRVWEREEVRERWYVGTICVKDEWRGRGVGKKLMEVAMERCRREGLPLTLAGTESGVFLYRKLGFETLESLKIPNFEKDNKYELMVWDPKKKD